MSVEEMCERGVAARSGSASSKVAALLDEVVGELLSAGLPPTEASHITGKAVRNHGWAQFRTGRMRVATMAASYLVWLAPPATWPFVGARQIGDRTGIVWASPDGEVVVDLLDPTPDGSPPDPMPVAEAFAGVAAVAAVRVVRVSAPMRSRLFTSPGVSEPLFDSELWFDGGRA